MKRRSIIRYKVLLVILLMSCHTFNVKEEDKSTELPKAFTYAEALSKQEKIGELINYTLALKNNKSDDFIKSKEILFENIQNKLKDEKDQNKKDIFEKILSYFDENYSTSSKNQEKLPFYFEAETKKTLDPNSLNEALKAVVTIVVDRGFRMTYGVGVPDKMLGSGFFINEHGYLITNYHVIQSEVDPKYEGRSEVFVKLSSSPQDKIKAKVIGYDSVMDLALLKVEIDSPNYLKIGRAEGIIPGTQVYALGSPGGLENTITRGIVSALGRRLLEFSSVIQIDASVNPGNSGGPLLGPEGSLEGVVFAGIEKFQGVNFAIPSKILVSLLPRLFAGGEIQHGFFGFQLVEIKNHLRISYVFPKSPADYAGFKYGDELISINGHKISTIEAAQDIILQASPYSKAEIVYKPGNQNLDTITSSETKNLEFFLDERLKQPTKPLASAGFANSIMVPLFGLKSKLINENPLRPQYSVLEVTPYSIADENNFAAGDSYSVLDFNIRKSPDGESFLAVITLEIELKTNAFVKSTIQLINLLTDNNFL